MNRPHAFCYEDSLIIDEQDRTIRELRGKVNELRAREVIILKALNLFRQASYQSHGGHWDSTMQHGAGCLECIRAARLRDEATDRLNSIGVSWEFSDENS